LALAGRVIGAGRRARPLRERESGRWNDRSVLAPRGHPGDEAAHQDRRRRAAIERLGIAPWRTLLVGGIDGMDLDVPPGPLGQARRRDFALASLRGFDREVVVLAAKVKRLRWSARTRLVEDPVVGVDPLNDRPV